MAQTIDLVRESIGFSVLYRTLLDMYLQFDLGFDYKQFEWNPVDFTGFLRPEFRVEFTPLRKAVYGRTKYGEGVYDPEEVSPKRLEQLVWELTQKFTHHKHFKYRHLAKTLEQEFRAVVDMLKGKGVSEDYLEVLKSVILKVEGKILNAGYWGCAIWGVSKWTRKTHKARDPDDLLTELDLETTNVYESYWDYDHWDYATWSEDGPVISEEFTEYLREKIREFFGQTEPVWFGTYLLQRSDEMHHTGGYHQIRLQDVIARVKRICHRHGVPMVHVYAYIGFANELLYMYYGGHRKDKQWRKMVTPDDIVEKYVRLGLDRSVLEEIRKALGL